MIEKPILTFSESAPSTSERKDGSEPNPTFKKDKLHILAQAYDNFEVGLEDIRAHETPAGLRLVAIRNFPSTSHSDCHAIFSHILQSLPKGEIDYETFRRTVQEVINILFEGKTVEVEFRDEPNFSYAIQCMLEDSLEPAKKAGSVVSEDVRKIFGYNRSQFYE